MRTSCDSDRFSHFTMDSQEEELLVIVALYHYHRRLRNKRKNRRMWVHNINTHRQEKGGFSILMPELYSDEEKFIQYFRLTREQFAQVLYLLGDDLQKKYVTREPISPRQRLAICLRYLASGESFRSLSYQFRCGESTISGIVREVCKAIWNRMAEMYMKFPTTTEEWELISANFDHLWNFPHCLGAVDGKHVVLRCPGNSGSLYYNYKKTFSINLMALMDDNLQFIAIDVGSFGRNNDAGVFADSDLGRAITSGQLQFPESKVLPTARELGPLPYVVIGDPGFALHRRLMIPYAGKGIAEDNHVFNYRLSRARRIVENGFGILAARWRIFHTKIAVEPEYAVDLVKASCLLHNLLQMANTPAQIVSIDHDNPSACEGLVPLNQDTLQRGRPSGGTDAKVIRELFKRYFNEFAPLPWQLSVVRRGIDL